jgi:hypothetical protein
MPACSLTLARTLRMRNGARRGPGTLPYPAANPRRYAIAAAKAPGRRPRASGGRHRHRGLASASTGRHPRAGLLAGAGRSRHQDEQRTATR